MRNIENVVNFLEGLKSLQEKYNLRLVCDDPYCCPYGGISDNVKYSQDEIDSLIKLAIKNEKIWLGKDLNYEPIEIN